MIDLHVHSKYSDGSNTIEEILRLADRLNLTQIAITDHNTLEGSILAHLKNPDKTIIGTELSVGYLDNLELHLLGYFPNYSDYKNVSFIIKQGELHKSISVTRMVENLNEQGYDIDINDLSEFASGTINRVHICRALMKKGYIESVAQGFSTLVGDHCPAYVPREYVPIEEAVEAIHNDGGIAVLAHPYNYKPIKDIPKLLDDTINLIDGVECFHPSASINNSLYLLDYVTKHNKRITGGSDYHGDNKPDISLNMMEVDDKYCI